MGKQRVKFTFEEELVKQPVIYELGRKFEIVTNIRRAESTARRAGVRSLPKEGPHEPDHPRPRCAR